MTPRHPFAANSMNDETAEVLAAARRPAPAPTLRRSGPSIRSAASVRIPSAAERAELKSRAQGGIAEQLRGGVQLPHGIAYRQAFWRFLSRGDDNLTDEDRSVLGSAMPDDEVPNEVRQFLEQRDLSAGTGSAGGYSVPQGFYDTLVRAAKAYSPILKLARLWETDNGRTAPVPAVDDTSNLGVQVAENAAATAQDLVFTKPATFAAWPYISKLVKFSWALAADTMLDIESVLAEILGERVGRGVGADLVTGNGTTAPEGIMTNSATGTSTTAAAGPKYVDLVALMDSVDSGYWGAGCVWLCNQATLKGLRNLVDTQSRPLWIPNQDPDSDLTPAGTILGFPVQIVPEMDNTGTAGKRPIAFGNLARAYTVRLVHPRFVVLRERFADNLQSAGFVWLRADAHLMDSRAVKALNLT